VTLPRAAHRAGTKASTPSEAKRKNLIFWFCFESVAVEDKRILTHLLPSRRFLGFFKRSILPLRPRSLLQPHLRPRPSALKLVYYMPLKSGCRTMELQVSAHARLGGVTGYGSSLKSRGRPPTAKPVRLWPVTLARHLTCHPSLERVIK
jgi:hypothetical protein